MARKNPRTPTEQEEHRAYKRNQYQKTKILHPRVRLSEEEKKLRKHKWMDANKERTAQVTHEYYLKHKEESIARGNKRKLENPENYILKRAQSSARTQGRDFNLEISDIVIPDLCPILGKKIEVKIGKGLESRPYSASLDRLDSTKGYVKGNVWVISNRANVMKNDASIEELILFSKSILRLFDK